MNSALTVIDFLYIGCFFLALLTCLALVTNAWFFYRRYYNTVAEKIDGAPVLDLGFMLAAQRFMLWGQCCLWPSQRFAQTREVMVGLPVNQQRMLKLHFIGVILGCLLFISGAVLGEYVG